MSKDTGKPAARARRGRPVGSPDRVRSHRVVTFVTDAEMAQLVLLSESADRSLSAVAHEILARSLRRRAAARAAGEQSE